MCRSIITGTNYCNSFLQVHLPNVYVEGSTTFRSSCDIATASGACTFSGISGHLPGEAEEDTAFVGATDGGAADDGVAVSVAIWVPNELLMVVVESSLPR